MLKVTRKSKSLFLEYCTSKSERLEYYLLLMVDINGEV